MLTTLVTLSTTLLFHACGYCTLSMPAAKQALHLTVLAEVRSGKAAAFGEGLSGVRNRFVASAVSRIPGGIDLFGRIKENKVYLAPSTAEAVTITRSSVDIPELPQSLLIQVLTSLPIITNADLRAISTDTFLIVVQGNGFRTSSSLLVGGVAITATVLSEHEIQARVSRAAYAGSRLQVQVMNPNPGRSISNARTVQIPAMPIGELLGCTNPNTGITTNKWGTSSAPVYLALNNDTPVVGTPHYSSNAVFWISRETAPGDSVLITGAFTPQRKVVKVARIPPGTMDWRSVLQARSLSVTPTQFGTTGLSFVIPAEIGAGVYAFEIDDPGAPNIQELANQPSLTWAIAVPATRKKATIWESPIHDCAAEPGQILRIFGKNFLSSHDVVFEATDGSKHVLRPMKQDSNSISIKVPSDLPIGTYFVWVGSDSWDPSSSAAAPISIAASSHFSSTQLVCDGLRSDSKGDNAAILQRCFDSGVAPLNANRITYIVMPAGSFVFKNTAALSIPTHEVLLGNPLGTTLVWKPVGIPETSFMLVHQYDGLVNLSINGPGLAPFVASADLTGNPSGAGHVILKNVHAAASSPAAHTQLVRLAGPDVQIYGSHFEASTPTNVALQFGDGAIFVNNTFIDDTGVNGITGSQNIIVENNEVFGKKGANPTSNDFLTMGRSFCAFCQSMISQNIYVGYNNIHDVGRPDAEVITNDGGGAAYYGPVATSSADSVTLADDPSWIWTGNSNPASMAVNVMYGQGFGQYRVIKGVNGHILTLQEPWVVKPDATSVVVVSSIQRTVTVAHNTFKNTSGMTITFACNLDDVFEDNNLINSGKGIKIWGRDCGGGPAGFPPMLNTEILRNTLSVGRGDLFISTSGAGIGVMNGYAGVVSGVMIRGNRVPPGAMIYQTNGTLGIDAGVAEHNAAKTMLPGFPRFLVRGNTIP